MKTLCLLRHAHSDHALPGMDDHDRLLSQRGEREAENVGAFMKEQGILPDALLSSTSVRTKDTARIALEVLFRGGKGDVSKRFERNLYLAPPDIITDEIRDTEDRFSRLLVIGHNPGFEDLAEKLASSTGEMIGKFPPAALAVFDCDIDDWRSFAAKHARLRLVFMP
jgi:phosphohistidine phosphatase